MVRKREKIFFGVGRFPPIYSGGAEHVGEGACGRCGGCVRATGAVVVPLADPKNVFAFNTETIFAKRKHVGDAAHII